MGYYVLEYITELEEVDKVGGNGKMICIGIFLNFGFWEVVFFVVGIIFLVMKYIFDGYGKIAYVLVRFFGYYV